jgi:hypothetical protein
MRRTRLARLTDTHALSCPLICSCGLSLLGHDLRPGEPYVPENQFVTGQVIELPPVREPRSRFSPEPIGCRLDTDTHGLSHVNEMSRRILSFVETDDEGQQEPFGPRLYVIIGEVHCTDGISSFDGHCRFHSVKTVWTPFDVLSCLFVALRMGRREEWWSTASILSCVASLKAASCHILMAQRGTRRSRDSPQGIDLMSPLARSCRTYRSLALRIEATWPTVRRASSGSSRGSRMRRDVRAMTKRTVDSWRRYRICRAGPSGRAASQCGQAAYSFRRAKPWRWRLEIG